jgi:hypothetical protein
MTERPYELVHSPAGTLARIRIRGSSILSSPLLNRGTAFTAEERQALVWAVPLALCTGTMRQGAEIGGASLMPDHVTSIVTRNGVDWR